MKLLRTLFAPSAPAEAPAADPAAEPPVIRGVELVPKHRRWVKLVGDPDAVRAAVARKNPRLAARMLRCASGDGIFAPRAGYMRAVAEQRRGRGTESAADDRRRARSDEDDEDPPSDTDDPTRGPGASTRALWALVAELRALRETVASRPVGFVSHSGDAIEGAGAAAPHPAFAPASASASGVLGSPPQRPSPPLPWRASDGASVVSVTLPSVRNGNGRQRGDGASVASSVADNDD